MKLCTRCDRDESVGIHVVIRRNGKEVAHLCRNRPAGGALWHGVEIQDGEIHTQDTEFIRE